MNRHSFLIDTNIFIGLEDNREIEESYSEFHRYTDEHKLDVFLHEASIEDISNDHNIKRQRISISKSSKYRTLRGMQGLTKETLCKRFGPSKSRNDLVDCKLLHSLCQNSINFLVTEDQGLHNRTKKYCSDLNDRVLFVKDACDVIRKAYGQTDIPTYYVKEMTANEIDVNDTIFDGLDEQYPNFDSWWYQKCVPQLRKCWVVHDGNRIAGLIVRKDECPSDSDVDTDADKRLKLCTFKVSPDCRGVKLGEMLLKQAMWFAQSNNYGSVYLTTFENQSQLITLLEEYGFRKSGCKGDEIILERLFSKDKLRPISSMSNFALIRTNYPKFMVNEDVKGFLIPIEEKYHDILFPDFTPPEPDLFTGEYGGPLLEKCGNTIRKVYLCRAQSNLGEPGSILIFYKSKLKKLPLQVSKRPSQALTVLGILEQTNLAKSWQDLIQLTGERCVYSIEELEEWEATNQKPVKVIKFLLVAYIDPPIPLSEFEELGISRGRAPQSIQSIPYAALQKTIKAINLDFEV